MDSSGLSTDVWKGVIEALEEFMPYYERVNTVSTLFQLPMWRKQAASVISNGEEVLEIGPGPGGFARLLKCRRVFLLEPSRDILRYATSTLIHERYVPVMGLAESIPLQEGTVDKVFCIFSFRDFMDKPRGLLEVSRVLRPGGQLHIVDLFRPPRSLSQWVMEIWLRAVAAVIIPMLVPKTIVSKWTYNPYEELVRTYRAVGTVFEYEGLMTDVGFKKVRSKPLMPIGVYHLQGERPSTTS